ncbi:transcriptional regulator [Mycobacterium sp. CBMA293]|uniref:BlaI/MecI/CopY family transcriptional regulator n=1 Tax=unclassified Mycolicibacterium TaxID=2636767 RepID=UPI0012DE2F38|nr:MULTISPECIES: BlaI/MecI/CopY family transcriptional regulator [unclassified Mycolicibacterium]MUL48265.1 transcriptional regulator [Mycolicibacterium sp. CBMA 360]MUL57567.1 transcriptional regulator [Mycolicibacterium sp. CBMA 335]MUL70607.1 transcriptional regulator [Mycolicibacterium sp. CBMA 311]MUL92655.1 transcriptional regulator [Mycolicibacterium sp. CBMA 230]MUM08332.1 transcriptional regulator [Mycolicibacterium sp. CBMA 213]
MTRLKHLGNLEREVMDQLWAANEPLTVREVHHAICAERKLAYTTIMTVLRRLAGKSLVLQLRQGRAHRYAAAHSRDQLVAGLMVDALGQASDQDDRHAALVHFVTQVAADEIDVLRRALATMDPHSSENTGPAMRLVSRRSA